MEEQPRTLREVFFKRHSVPFFEDFGSYVRSRKPSDQLILTTLACLVLVSSIYSLLSLERHLLVTQPAYGGSLTEGEVDAPRYINPLLAISETDEDLSALTYAGLMGQDAEGNLTPVLAKSYIISPDGKTYQFTLRENIRFSDGSPVTAEDVVYTVNKAKDPALKSPEYSNWSNTTVTALNSTTVQFTLKSPYAPFLQDATLGILPAHLWRNVTNEEFPFSDLMIKPVGAGPFIPRKVFHDSKGVITRYDFARNPHYALGKPYLDGLHFLFYKDQASLQTAIHNGTVESGYGVVGTHVLTAPYARVFAIFFNPGQSDLFKQLPVRQALSVAIDRSAIIENILGGYGTARIGPVPPGSGIPDLPLPSVGDRIASSTSILQAGGWAFSTSTQEWKNASGQTLSVTLKTSSVPELRAIATAVQADWKQLGVPMSLQFYEPGDLAQNVIRPRAYQALLFGMVVGKGDDLYDFWNSKQKTDPGLNVSSYSNTDVDTLLTKLRSATSNAEHIQDLTEINRRIAADYPAAFIDSPDFVYVVPNNLKGVILPQITSPADRFATVATWYRRTESVWPFLARSK